MGAIKLMQRFGRSEHAVAIAAVLWILTTGPAALVAQESPTEADAPTADDVAPTGGEDATVDAEEESSFSWMILPGAFYSQETSLGFAVFASTIFDLPDIGEETRPSSVTFTATYTLEKQASVTLWPTFYLGEANDWIILSDMTIEHYSNRFFGVGCETTGEYQPYVRRGFEMMTEVQRRVVGSFYIGVVHELFFRRIRDVGPVHNTDETPFEGEDPPVLFDDPILQGRYSSRLHGLGLIVAFDNRDSAFSPRRGVLARLDFTGFPSFLGSDHRFTRSRIDLRGFIPLGECCTVGGHWLTELRTGEVPFTSQYELGGDYVLRGIYEGRFRDYNATALQTEFRFPIIWRLEAAAFFGFGQVFRAFDDLSFDNLVWTAGGGLRFLIDVRERSVVRLDVGGGPDGFGFIFAFGEAF